MVRVLFLVLCVAVLVSCVTPQRFKDWALGDPAFHGATDARRGLIYVEYRTDASGEDPLADSTGLIKRAVHLCGPAMTFTLAVLRNDLRWRYDHAAEFKLGDPITCKDDVCSHGANYEFDVTGDYTFTEDKLRHVVRIEGGTITESFRRAGRAYANQQIAALSRRTCP